MVDVRNFYRFTLHRIICCVGEAVSLALAKHTLTSVHATRSSLRAIGSIAHNDEGNMLRFFTAGTCGVLVKAIKTHGLDAFTAEYGFRAVYALCAENTNVSELGAKGKIFYFFSFFADCIVGACGLAAAALKSHTATATVVTQTCLAISRLSVKSKTDKVHKGNTRKLVAKGSIELVIAAMKQYPKDTELQRAGIC